MVYGEYVRRMLRMKIERYISVYYEMTWNDMNDMIWNDSWQGRVEAWKRLCQSLGNINNFTMH